MNEIIESLRSIIILFVVVFIVFLLLKLGFYLISFEGIIGLFGLTLLTGTALMVIGLFISSLS